jgi:hypothetical protein
MVSFLLPAAAPATGQIWPPEDHFKVCRFVEPIPLATQVSQSATADFPADSG